MPWIWLWTKAFYPCCEYLSDILDLLGLWCCFSEDVERRVISTIGCQTVNVNYYYLIILKCVCVCVYANTHCSLITNSVDIYSWTDSNETIDFNASQHFWNLSMLSKELILHISSINSLSLPRSTPAKFLIMFCDMCQRHKRCVVHGNNSAMALLKFRSLSVNNTFVNVFVASPNYLHAHTYDSYVSSL